MAFSSDQATALAALDDHLKQVGVDLQAGAAAARREGDAPASVVAVVGAAGSGKTVLLQALSEKLAGAGLTAVSADVETRRKAGRSFAVLAPTNKAASVLRARGVPATTIHRVLYVPVYDPEFEKVVAWLSKPDAGPAPVSERLPADVLERIRLAFAEHGSAPAALAMAGFSGSDFITGWSRREEALDVALVDEASMLDDAMMADLKAIFGMLVLFGDPAQLAPVGQSGAMVFDRLPPDRRLSLSRVHRQSADSPILDLAYALQEDIDFEDFEALVRRTAAADARVVLAERADADLMTHGPMLCWRNATRVRLIAGYRAAHGLAEDALAPGEPLICDGIELPMKHRRKRIDLEARGLIKGAQVEYLGEGRKGGFARLNVVGAEKPRVNVAAIIKIEAPDREEPLIATAARMGASFVHGAACTIHKAQGSQWPDVQVFAPDLYAAARSGRSEAGAPLWRRLAYVAVTRAQERLHWVTRWRMSRPAQPLTAEGLPGLAAPPAEADARRDADPDD